MALHVGEIGKSIVVNAAYDMSANTDLKLIFTKPDQTTLTVDKAGGVSAPSSTLVVTIDGVSVTLAANEYWLYATSSGDLDQAGTWSVVGQYIDATPKLFCGESSTFTVLPC